MPVGASSAPLASCLFSTAPPPFGSSVASSFPRSLSRSVLYFFEKGIQSHRPDFERPSGSEPVPVSQLFAVNQSVPQVETALMSVMSGQQFCLKWNNYQSNMSEVFQNMLLNENLVDVTLACEGANLKAHRMVLAACSPYFQSLFITNPCKHPIVILKDVRFVDLKAIIDFMYRGEVNVSQDQLSALLKTAETLKGEFVPIRTNN